MKSRNRTVDVVRGFAMLLVVLGHTMSGSIIEYQNSFLFQVIWTLQMPLFIIISGYVTRYSQPITNGETLWKFIKKRSLAYLLPWAVWTYMIRGVIFGQSSFFDFKYLFWHMDSGYWFLITIWTISMIYAISDYVANKLSIQKSRNILLHLFICAMGMSGLFLLGMILGFNFFSVKLSLYYFPFYLLGYLYGHLQDWLFARKDSKIIIDIISTAFWTIWLFLIVRYDFYSGSDSGLFILFRFFASIVGCIAIISLLVGINNQKVKFFHWSGVHSLEIYLTHYLFLNMIKVKIPSSLMTLDGIIMLVINFVLTLVFTIIIIRLIQNNNIMNYLLYGKKVRQSV